MLDPPRVGERVAGDAGRDREAVGKAARRRPAQPAHQEDAGPHEGDAGRFSGRGPDSECDDPGEQHDHRSEAAGDGIDDAELGPAVGGGEERHVSDLERRRDRQVRDGRRLDVPAEHCERRERERTDGEGDGRRCRDVRSPSEGEVPAGVERSGGERECECRAVQGSRKTRPTGARLMRRTLRHAQPARGRRSPSEEGLRLSAPSVRARCAARCRSRRRHR